MPEVEAGEEVTAGKRTAVEVAAKLTKRLWGEKSRFRFVVFSVVRTAWVQSNRQAIRKPALFSVRLEN